MKSKLRPGLVEAHCAATGDRETELGTWLRQGAPLGLATEVRGDSGILPPVSVEQGTREEFESLTAKIKAAQFTNYASF